MREIGERKYHRWDVEYSTAITAAFICKVRIGLAFGRCERQALLNTGV